MSRVSQYAYRHPAIRGLARVRYGPRAEIRGAILSARIAWYRLLSTQRSVFADAAIRSPVLAIGEGAIHAAGATLGYWPSPAAFDSCIYLEARHHSSLIEIGHGSVVNNGTVMISKGPGIVIGASVLVGPGVTFFDSDFHALDTEERLAGGEPQVAQVRVGDGAFIGANAIVLKGVAIGEGAVVGAGSVVRSNVPERSVVSGNPASVVHVL